MDIRSASEHSNERHTGRLVVHTVLTYAHICEPNFINEWMSHGAYLIWKFAITETLIQICLVKLASSPQRFLMISWLVSGLAWIRYPYRKRYKMSCSKSFEFMTSKVYRENVNGKLARLQITSNWICLPAKTCRWSRFKIRNEDIVLERRFLKFKAFAKLGNLLATVTTGIRCLCTRFTLTKHYWWLFSKYHANGSRHRHLGARELLVREPCLPPDSVSINWPKPFLFKTCANRAAAFLCESNILKTNNLIFKREMLGHLSLLNGQQSAARRADALKLTFVFGLWTECSEDKPIYVRSLRLIAFYCSVRSN